MSEEYYNRWFKRFAILAVFNSSIGVFNVYQVVVRIIAERYGDAMFSTGLVILNFTCAGVMVYRAWQLRKEQKEKVWEILSTPENQIW